MFNESSWKSFGALANNILLEVERKRRVQQAFAEERALRSGSEAVEQKQLMKSPVCQQVLDMDEFSIAGGGGRASVILFKASKGGASVGGFPERRPETLLDISIDAFPLANARRPFQAAH